MSSTDLGIQKQINHTQLPFPPLKMGRKRWVYISATDSSERQYPLRVKCL